MAQPAKEHRMTIAEYLEFEQSSPIKHEFADGKLFAMAGGSDEHSRIVRNFGGLLWQATATGPCESYPSDMKVRANEVFYYPDAMVSCDPQDNDTTPENRFFKSHPCLLVEVLSPSTESVDRGEKLFNYRTISELQTYVIAHQNRVRLEVFRRAGNGLWTYETLDGDAVLKLVCPKVEIKLIDVYRSVKLPDSSSLERASVSDPE